MRDNTRRDRIRNDNIKERFGVARIVEKITKTILMGF
jgi:hypothetical protein